MTKYISLLCIFLMVILSCEDKKDNSSEPVITFQKVFGGPFGDDRFIKVIQTKDNGYVVGGTMLELTAGGILRTGFVTKRNRLGDILWTKTWPAPIPGTRIWDIMGLSDGSLVVSGDPSTRKLSNLGEQLWIANRSSVVGHFSSGGYAVSTPPQAGKVLVKGLSEGGDSLWSTQIDTVIHNGSIVRIIGSNDGNAFVIVRAYDIGFYVAKLSPTGQLLWKHDYINIPIEQIDGTTDGGLIGVGYFVPPGRIDQDIRIVKVNANGEMMWTKSYGKESDFETGFGITEVKDGGFSIVGTDYPPVNQQVYLIRTDALGNKLWSRTYGGNRTDEGHSVKRLPMAVLL